MLLVSPADVYCQANTIQLNRQWR